MPVRIGLAPELTDGEKTALRRWLVHVLGQPNLCGTSSSYNFPLNGRIAVYIDGLAYPCYHGYWDRSDGVRLKLGADSGNISIPMDVRLAILSAIISAAGLWDLTEQFSAAVCRTLLESYNTSMSGLVRTTQGVPTGLAFNASSNQVAALMGGGWHLPNGGAIEIAEGNTDWVVVQ